jgi:hypothetical protein
MENTVEKHFGRIKERLSKGAAKIREMVRSGEPFQTADIPFVKPDQTFVGREPPRYGDKWVVPQTLSYHLHLIFSCYHSDSTSQLTSGRLGASNTFAHMVLS